MRSAEHTQEHSVTPRETVLVVGAGSAGCIVAARLSEDPWRNVILFEAGEDHGQAPELQSVNWLDALGYRAAFYPDLFAAKTVGGVPRLYQRGRGIGGSAATNAMLALPGLPSDYDNYAEKYGLSSWSWENVSPWFDTLKCTLRRSSAAEQTPVDRALLRSGSVLGLPDAVDSYTPDDGSALLYRTADQHGRRSSRELWLDPALDRPNLTVRAGSQVDRIVFAGNRATGVRLADGEEVAGDRVILCAGTFESPCILMRSGIEIPGLGQGLQDHPAISLYFSMKPEFRETNPDIPCIGAVMRCSSSVGAGDLHLLPLHGALAASTPQAHGLLMVAVMRTRSQGSLRLNPEQPLAPPLVDARMLEDPADRLAMREGVTAALRVLAGSAFQDIVEHVFIDERGTPATELVHEEKLEQWISRYVGDYFHAVGTARMGHADDPGAVVDERGNVHGLRGVSIWDASILPEVPSANTHLPVVMLAERLSSAYRSGTFA